MAEVSAMPLTTPDWLALHDGELRPSADGRSWSVWLGGNLVYVLQVVPAGGKFACRVVQTNNGKRLDQGGVFASPEAAAQGGLEDLRAALGW
jgi:hypothetical protein